MKVLSGLLVGLVTGVSLAYGMTPSAHAPTSDFDVITTYNDGWVDSKDDVCQETGDKYACYWLMNAAGIPLPPEAAEVLGN
ncbi:hypothetical protein [Streptomyces sp. H34-S4]|uniref:hypothetical protein n=1 Tax=Streptomyces sp. H34-S4 TaxID=2996463 RepID=UPI00226D4D29|nr:hypothetical protein [Streptomyces sp. H34-S4]MCY0933648.1 hypothetical protein [Streptomyces sp. H34-S4]